jgi:class 3 adenylate cyclase
MQKTGRRHASPRNAEALIDPESAYAMAAICRSLAAHDDVLRQAVDSHHGWLFKHTGDGVCAAFASPRCAVAAALAAQQAPELPVRMGLATA